ncbi:hypothetical protein EYF80_024780 [Liparis tanakae]|uniref:Secreted protein n=1 Tax=Liparis tanakae TaxID=230148 RepID=A0A4Z2HHF6_9TELE|nr:hypothetical protein EYF80_024780 [Liparis tanakae]
MIPEHYGFTHSGLSLLLSLSLSRTSGCTPIYTDPIPMHASESQLQTCTRSPSGGSPPSRDPKGFAPHTVHLHSTKVCWKVIGPHSSSSDYKQRPQLLWFAKS